MDCHFPPPQSKVDLAVSGGPDSLGLLLLALSADLLATVHHVDHHARPTSGRDAEQVERTCHQLGVGFVRHDVTVEPGGNFESRARTARRQALPAGAMTGHTMDDLAETVLLNMLRGERRAALHDFVAASSFEALYDETNESPGFRRNRVRRELMPLMCDVAGRDVVPLLARQAGLMHDERTWLDLLSRSDETLTIESADCRELREWPTARLRRWLRVELRAADQGDGHHPPSADEVERAIGVVRGEVVATELSGGRRLARRDQHLTLE
jgi:tRNA(Ile)-lysidine synthase